MRVYGPNGLGAAAQATPMRRAVTGGFSVGSDNMARAATSATAPRVIGGIDTLLALQGLEDPAERRRRGVGRGRSALDALDVLKLGLLGGTLSTATLANLKSTVAGLSEGTGEPELDHLLAEIGLRVEVELAKIGMPPGQKQPG